MTQTDQHLTEHLAELRRRILVTLAVFLLTLCAALVFVDPVYIWLTRDVQQELTLLGPTDGIWVYLMIAGVFAIAVTIPVAGFQLWRFVSPGLHSHERRMALGYVPALAVLFLAGISFGYFVIYPMVLAFLTSISDNFQISYTAEKYFRFMINMTVPFGVLFEMPVIVMFLTSLGILNPVRLAKMRKMAYFLLTIVAVTITPPDFVSDVLVIVPLFLLYEISIGMSRLVYKKRQARLNEDI
ncbi:twin-arginine translocase subunit TatC [Paenibacillus sp. TRM 82003]|nr:twin-arginine translocase subunit TatC [Paenibacillus sp. TRM 82003]